MASGLRRLARLFGGAEETTRCARALTGLLGAVPTGELLPHESSRITRALLTARVVQSLEPVPWPAAMNRQLHPDDPAFLPPLGMHLVLSARDRTVLGLPGRNRLGWVDPLGWCGVEDSPAVGIWFSVGREGYPMGRRPDEAPHEAPAVVQRRSDDGHGILTTCKREGLTVELFHWPVVLQGRVACALVVRMILDAPAQRPVRLGFAIRPAGLEGVEPIFDLSRSAEGLWKVEGRPILALAQGGDEVLTAVHNEPDPWSHFSGRRIGKGPTTPQALSLACPSGLARATEVYRTTLSPHEPFERFAVIAPSVDVSAALVRTSGRSLWRGAIADRRGLLAAGAELTIPSHQWLLDAARQRVLVDNSGPSLAGCLGAVALARLGFVRRAGQRLGHWMSQIRRDGHVLGARGEEESVLAWAAAEYTRWTGERGWVREHRQSWRRLLNRICSTQPVPGGQDLFGREGSLQWSALWRTAALLDGVVALRKVVDKTENWALEGGRAREGLNALLGSPPWAARTGRAADGSSAGMVAAAWLGLLPCDHPGVLATVDHVMKHHLHGEGVFLQGGAHPAATALLMAVRFRQDPTTDRLGPLAALAASTGAFPSARHTARGALGEGDDALSAALFLLLVLDAVQVRKGTLVVVTSMGTARDLPTPFGRIDITPEGDIIGRWRSDPPQVLAIT